MPTIHYLISGKIVGSEPFDGRMPRIIDAYGQQYSASYWPQDHCMVCDLWAIEEDEGEEEASDCERTSPRPISMPRDA